MAWPWEAAAWHPFVWFLCGSCAVLPTSGSRGPKLKPPKPPWWEGSTREEGGGGTVISL